MSAVLLVDGGDRSCGELLLVLAKQARGLPPGSHVRLVATDPAAALDLPAWCHLTGHGFLGSGVHTDGRPHYDLRTCHRARETRADQPWRLTEPVPSAGPDREETPS
ncbi:MAG: hypothetical protein WB441_13980 [Nocardioidaceae bacterium]